MLKQLLQSAKTAIILLLFLTILTGIFYPLSVTAIAQLFFPWQANGSLIEQNGKPIGSMLIGQLFSSPGYFWGRPSMTMPFPYNGESSIGSNFGPTNLNFLAAVQQRIEHLRQDDEVDHDQLIPVDLVTASGSGLDPDISPYAAHYQAPRIAKARHLPLEKIEALIQSQVKDRSFYILGEPRVNVLQLNLALDNMKW